MCLYVENSNKTVGAARAFMVMRCLAVAILVLEICTIFSGIRGIYARSRYFARSIAGIALATIVAAIVFLWPVANTFTH